MNKFSIIFWLLMGVLVGQTSCTDQSADETPDEEIEIDSFRYLTPCMIEIVKDFKTYVQSDTIAMNDNFSIDMVVFLDVDSVRYYWIRTNYEDETEYILTGDCEEFCWVNGWGIRDKRCLEEFYDRTWVLAWR